MEFNWNNVIQLVEILAWPLFVAAIVVTFKDSIKTLIEGISKVSFGGAEVETIQRTPDKEVPDDVDISEQEEEDPDEDTRLSEKDKLQTALFYERIYNVIFGSQITILEKLRNTRSQGIPYTNLLEVYENFKDGYKSLKTLSFADYLGFMRSSGLIEVPTDSAGKIKITDSGLDFLRYIEEQGYRKNKPL